MKFKLRFFLRCARHPAVAFACAAFCATVHRASGQPSNTAPSIDLPTVLQLAGGQNLDVQIARQRLAEAKANHQSTLWQFFPWISPGISYRRHDDLIQDVAGNVIEVHKESYSAGPTLSAQMDIGDAIYKNLAARQLVKAADFGLDSQRLDSLLAAVQAYFDLAKAAALSGVITESLRVSQDYQGQLHEGVLAGIAFKGDELRVQVQTERYQLALRQCLEQERLHAARLAQILRLDPAVPLKPRETDFAPLTLVQTNTAMDSLVKQALHSRPEMFQGQALTAAAEETKKGVVYGPLIPSLGAQAFLGGLGGGKEGGPSTSFGFSEDYLLGLSWRIGPGGLFDSGRARAARARLEITRLAHTKLMDEITRQVVEAFTRAQSLADQLLTARTNLATASETFRLTRERKQLGVAAVLEDIQAQQDLTRARSDYLNIIAEYNKAQYALDHAIGKAPGISSRSERGIAPGE